MLIPSYSTGFVPRPPRAIGEILLPLTTAPKTIVSSCDNVRIHEYHIPPVDRPILDPLHLMQGPSRPLDDLRLHFQLHGHSLRPRNLRPQCGWNSWNGNGNERGRPNSLLCRALVLLLPLRQPLPTLRLVVRPAGTTLPTLATLPPPLNLETLSRRRVPTPLPDLQRTSLTRS